MSGVGKIRDLLAVFAIAALALSAALVVGSFARHVVSTDYFKQADEGRPWVQWGLISSLAAFVFSFFHKGALRMVTVLFGLVLMWLWYGMGMSLI